MKISIDGNIGSGKSTVITQLEKHFSNTNKPISFIQEPVKEWLPYLTNFYNDMKNSGLALQMKILKHHLAVPISNKNEIIITERSTTSCIDIFGKHLLNSGLLNDLDISLMKDYEKSFGKIPDIYIYINTDPIVCHQRINKRDRKSEDMISIEYINNISDLYNREYVDCINKDSKFVVDGNGTPESIYNQILDIIRKFM